VSSEGSELGKAMLEFHEAMDRHRRFVRETSRCRTCAYFVAKVAQRGSSMEEPEPDPVQGILGRCLRRAPQEFGHPITYETAWCGEYERGEALP